jgi:hypothetical protein
MLTPRERQLLERLADEGKPTKLEPDEVQTARELASVDLAFISRDTVGTDQIYAVVTPKGWGDTVPHTSGLNTASLHFTSA